MAAVTQIGKNAGYAARSTPARAGASSGPLLVLNPDVELGEVGPQAAEVGRGRGDRRAADP